MSARDVVPVRPLGGVDIDCTYLPYCGCGWEGNEDYASMEEAEGALDDHQTDAHGGANYQSQM